LKKIILIRPKIGFGLGGAETMGAILTTKFLDYGYEVGIIATKINFPQDILDKISFYPIKIKGRGSILKYWLFLKQAMRILKIIDYDYLVSPFRFPGSDLLILCDPLQRFWIEQKPENFVVKKLNFLRPRYRFLLNVEKESIESAKKIIALFRMGKELISQYYPQTYSKTFICNLGLDFNRFNPELKQNKANLKTEFGFSHEDYLILFTGYNPRRKGLPLLLGLMNELPENVKLLIAGVNGKSTNRIIYLGKIGKIEKYYAISDLVVLPTYYDPGAMVTLEALASGSPVITSIFDGSKEFIKEGINGFVTNLEKGDLRNKILQAMNISFDPYICSQTIQQLTWDNYVRCVINILSGI